MEMNILAIGRTIKSPAKVPFTSHRVGVCEYANGNRYKGEWENDKKNGQGQFNYSNGNKYEGQWKDDKKHGRGNSSKYS